MALSRILTRWRSRPVKVNQRYMGQIPVRRLGTPGVRRVDPFLCGPDAGFVSSAIIDISSGFYMP